MIKKLGVIVTFLTLMLHLSIAHAATYYVRCDGGTPAQCDGTHDLPQAGAVDGADAGTIPDCALNSPNYPIGGNQTAGGAAAIMAASDTIIIDGEKRASCPATTSGRAEYVVGFNAPNITTGNGCYNGGPYNCTNNQIISGLTAATPTKIYGKGWDIGCPRPPQIWGDGGAYRVFRIPSNVDMRCLEITDHSGCMWRHQGKGNIDNSGSQDPILCSEPYQSGGTAYAGRWARTGIEIVDGSHDITLKDIWDHGMAYKAMVGSSLTGNFVFERLYLKAAYDSLFTGADGANYTGNYSWTKGGLYFAGCGERYPPTYPIARSKAKLRDMTDLHDCTSQDQGGYGDAEARSAQSGNWIFENIDCFKNVSDCIDHLYDSVGSVKARHSTFEGTAGAAIKSSQINVDIENNVLLGNCASWVGSPIIYGSITAPGRSGSNCNHDGQCNANENFTNCSSDCATFNYCRPANHSTISLVPVANAVHNIKNNTIAGNDDATILENNDGTCNGTAQINIKNNIIMGSTDFNNGDVSDYYFGNCGSGPAPVANEDYNYICQTKTFGSDCTGAHSHCYANCSSLNLTGPITNFSPTYYQGTNYLASYFLLSTSPAHGSSSADETVSLTGTSDDATLFKRRLVWDAGGLEYRPSFDLSTDSWNVSQ